MLITRGIKLEDIFDYLNTTDDAILDYNTIDNIEEGVKMLFTHIMNEDDILVQVDPDADGYCSAAILINYLNKVVPGFTQNHLSYQLHLDKTHGIVADTIPTSVKMVIAPDSSSNEEDVHRALKEQGIDVLVIDHHEAPSVSKYACVINNQLCHYDNKALCGAAMVYKFCCFIDNLLGEDYAEYFLDLTALALVGDMMDIRVPETKRLIEKGTVQINNPLFKALSQRQRFQIEKGGGLNPFTIAWYIAPLINGMVRSGTPEEKHLMFESMLEFKAYELITSNKRGAARGAKEQRVEQAVRTCGNVKTRQDNIKKANVEVLDKIIEKEQLLEKHKILILKVDKENPIDTNLTGLIANQLAAKYQRPTLVLNYKINNDGRISWEGSGRNYSFSPIENFKKLLNDTELIKFAEGHPNAMGVGIYDEDLKAFVEKTDEMLKDINFVLSYKVDFIFQGSDVKNRVITELGNYRTIWGQELPEPLVAVENATFTPDQILLRGAKRDTIIFTFPSGVEAIIFSSSEEVYQSLIEKCGYHRYTFIGTCDINEFGGNCKPQIKVKDFDSHLFF